MYQKKILSKQQFLIYLKLSSRLQLLFKLKELDSLNLCCLIVNAIFTTRYKARKILEVLFALLAVGLNGYLNPFTLVRGEEW